MHYHHNHCDHQSLKYCQQCQVPYCVNCGKEWRNYWNLSYGYYNNNGVGPLYNSVEPGATATPTATICKHE